MRLADLSMRSGGQTQPARLRLRVGSEPVQHISGLQLDHVERAPESVGHDGDELVSRAHCALLGRQAALDVDLDRAALEFVGGVEVAR